MRYLVLGAAVLLQLCLGGIYAWSTFVPVLIDSYALSAAQTQSIFGVSIAVFTLTTIYAGRLMLAIGPRRVASISGLLFAFGYMIASISQGSFPLLLLGLGLVTGTAIGLGYICPLSTAVEWFPEQKGLVTGLAVAGFGGGAVVLTNLLEVLLPAMDVLLVFRVVGLTYGLLVIFAAQFLHLPPGIRVQKKIPPTLSRPLYRDARFWRIGAAMFAGTFSGLLIIGNLTTIGTALGVDPPLALAAISGFAAGNASGRIIWGMLYDRLGAKTLPLSMLASAAAAASLIPASAFGNAFVFTVSLVGFCFGACFVLYAARVVDIYGPRALATVYPYVFLCYGAAAASGPVIGGWMYDLGGSYLPGIYLASFLALIGTVLLIYDQSQS